jgi:hypothetical protein
LAVPDLGHWLLQSTLDSLVAGTGIGEASRGLRWESFLASWSDFADYRSMLRLIVGLLLSVALTAIIAFHPRRYPQGITADEIAYPRTLFVYGIVGAMIAEAVVIHPPVAFVVFGIGGLLRFRTNVGAASDTGQLILVTIIGIACGLHAFPLAVLGAGMGWLLLFLLPPRVTYLVDIHGVRRDEFADTLRNGAEGVSASGCSVVHTRSRRSKNRITFVGVAPLGVTGEDIEKKIREKVGTDVEVEVGRE